MWSRFVLLLLVGATVHSLASTDTEHGWKVGHEYQYLVRSRTLTALNTLSDQYTGIVIKAILQIQCSSPNTLRAQLLMPQYAQIHKELQNGWESHISDQMLEYVDLPISKQPFVINMKHGVVRDLIMDKNVPTWEVNIIKSIVSQLQADTQGENGRRTKYIQVPQEKNPFAMFHVMEDSVGGKCEVLYDITPLPDYVLQDHPELVPKPELKGDGEHIYIMKTKNYEKCEERVDYHFGISGNVNWNSHRKNDRNFMTKSSTSSIVISGDLKSFAIQSSVTRNQIIIKPRLMDEQDSVVMNKMNLTLASIGKVSVPIPAPNNPESTGSLIYAYNKPFSATEHRRSRRPSVSPNSNSVEFNDGSTWTDSDQNSGDNLVSDEDTTFWQTKPSLEEAPENPLLPLFIGNKGKAVLMSDKIDAIKNVKRLLEDIVNELEEPNSMPDQETLEKFTILSRLISSMSLAQIQKVEEDLHAFWNELRPDEKNQAKQENAKAVFRDAIADAGTGPALLTIKNWIEQKKIQEHEAAMVISRLPRTARMPTIQYMDTFFQLATNPEVQKEMFLNSSAILSFAELVYLAHVSNSSIHNNYPVHSFGRPSSRHNDVVVTKYIPFMAEQLRKAIKDGDSPRIQVYTLALGSTGHPKILSVFEPYLEGKEQVSTFQRLMMVASLGKLAEHKPTLTRSVLYKIYLNTWEAHQVRCAAVFILMKMNPPLDMVLRMAKFTNYDYSAHVNSAVKSSINQAAEMESSGWQEYAKQAQDYLTPDIYGFPYSESIITETNLRHKDLAYKVIFDYIGSDDNYIPSALYLSLQSTYGRFVAPADEAGFMVSSTKNLIEMFWQKQSTKGENKETFVEKIAKILNIESDYPEQVEGNYFQNTKYMNHFFAFDNHTIENLPQVLLRQYLSMKKGKINTNRLMSYDINLSYPTETGLPFVYSLRIPTLTKLSATTNNMEFDFRFVSATKIQGRVGFVTPFDQQHFVSGIDMKAQLFIPGKVAVEMKSAEDGMKVEVNLRASSQHENIRMLHLSVVPYTSQHSVLSLRPLLLEKNTQIISKEEQSRIKIPPEEQDSAFVLEINSADFAKNMEWRMKDDHLTDWLMFPAAVGRGVHESLDFYLKPGGNGEEAVTFKGQYQTKNIRTNHPSEPDEKTWKSGNKAPHVKSNIPDSNERRSNFLQDVAVGMNSGNAYVIDAALELPGTLRSRHIVTVAIAESDVERKYRSLFYWHTDVPNAGIKTEMCGNTQMKSRAIPPFDFEKILKSNPTDEISMHVRYGEKCSEGREISAKGKFIQSEDYKEYIRDTDVAKNCKQKTNNGIQSLEDCEQAADWANAVDELKLSINCQSDAINDFMDQLVAMAREVFHTKYSLISSHKNEKYNDEDSLKMYLKLSPDYTTIDGAISTSAKKLSFSNVDLEELGLESDDIQDAQGDGIDLSGLCTIGTNEALTFDGKAYSVKLGKCSHVLTTTYPKINHKNHKKLWSIPDDEKVSVIAREVENDKKEVTIALGDDKVILKPSDSQLKVIVNGENVDCSRASSYQQVKDGETVFEIYEIPGPAIKLTSEEYDFYVIYDGKRVQVKLSTNYQKSVRGLCGDFDGQPENDFVTPKNCILKKPEEFAATYALKDQCDKETLKHAKMAERSMCAEKVIRLSDVISDEEAGRSTTNWKHWGYHKKGTNKQCNSYRTQIISKDDKICFTMRPVPMCSNGCVPVETKQKKYQLYCLEKNSVSLGMKRRVEQGANPDLSQLPSSDTKILSVPLECTAA